MSASESVSEPASEKEQKPPQLAAFISEKCIVLNEREIFMKPPPKPLRFNGEKAFLFPCVEYREGIVSHLLNQSQELYQITFSEMVLVMVCINPENVGLIKQFGDSQKVEARKMTYLTFRPHGEIGH